MLTKTTPPPPCPTTVDHALTDCLFLKVAFDLIQKCYLANLVDIKSMIMASIEVLLSLPAGIFGLVCHIRELENPLRQKEGWTLSPLMGWLCFQVDSIAASMA